ncbi:hypothetical protein M5Z94_10020 [Oceanotoga teriensis]|nr:hypothetical protein [Oceanotoga teriensis]MDO7977243.1 hypothetical protein [Oceanotoga teriensis]
MEDINVLLVCGSGASSGFMAANIRKQIKKVITSIDEVDKIEKSDLLISTVPIFENIPKNTVIITPFINYKDIDMIKEKIEKIKINKKKIRLKRHLVKISNPKFFYRNLEFKNDKEALRFMTKIMEEEGYIEKSDYNEILERNILRCL